MKDLCIVLCGLTTNVSSLLSGPLLWNKFIRCLAIIPFISGTYETLLSSLSLSMTDTGSTLTRHSSYTWMRDTCEEEDTCLLATQLRRRYEEVRSRAMQRAEPRQEEVKIKNLIFNFRYEIQKVTCRYYVTSRLLSHSKPPLLQWSISTSDMNKTIILAPDTLNPWTRTHVASSLLALC